jgi:hypothetical protein
MKKKTTTKFHLATELEIQSPCTAIDLRDWLTKTSNLVKPSVITAETQAFLKQAEKEAYEGQKGWEFTPTRFMILLSLLRESTKGKVNTYADIWPYLMVLSMPDEAAEFIQIDLENDRFIGMPGLAEVFKKGMGKCTNTPSTSGSKPSRASMPRRKKKRSKG